MLFSEAIRTNIKKYKKNSNKAYRARDYERAEFLFDSLINNVVRGTYMDNFQVRKISGRKLDFSNYKKPVFLITYSSWCTPGIGEIPALNKIAKEYSKEIDFVVLFWDSRKNTRKATRQYCNKINIVYVDEKENRNNYIVNRIKHSLGLPISFMIDADKRILSVQRGAAHRYNEKYDTSFDLNYRNFEKGIYFLTNNKEDTSPGVVYKK